MDSTPQRRQQSKRRRRHQSDTGASHKLPEPAIDILFPTATVSDQHASTTLAADQALVTQFRRGVGGLDDRALSVVTVTQTQSDSGANTGGSDTVSQSASIPIGVIVGSIAVGVVLACAVVGGWVWWGRRLKAQGRYGRHTRPSHMKNQTSQSSTARLKPSPSSYAPTSPRQEKAQPQYPKPTPPRQYEHHGSREPRTQRTQPAGGVAAAAGVPAPVSAVSTPVSKARPPQTNGASPSSVASTEGPASPASTLVATDEPTSKPTPAAKSYTPQKPSPLAQGAPRPKLKPQEKAKVNDWATPISPTKSSSHGHGTGIEGSRSTSDHDLNDNKAKLAVPVPAAYADPRKDRISVLSAESYYAPEPSAEDDGEVDYNVGVALGGDDPSPGYEGYPPRQPADGTTGDYFGAQHYTPQYQYEQPQQQQGWGR